MIYYWFFIYLMINDILFLIVIIMFFILKKTFKKDKNFIESIKNKTPMKLNSKNNYNEKINNNLIIKEKIKLDFGFNLSKNTEETLERISFNQDEFLNQINYIVDAIYNNIFNSDFEKIRKNISTDLYKTIIDKNESFKKNNKFLKSNLISVLTKKIQNIYIKNKTIFIDTTIETEQINYIENSQKELLKGNKKHINTIKENWIFSKSINNLKSYWIVDNIKEI